jgi:hypothetical protein
MSYYIYAGHAPGSSKQFDYFGQAKREEGIRESEHRQCSYRNHLTMIPFYFLLEDDQNYLDEIEDQFIVEYKTLEDFGGYNKIRGPGARLWSDTLKDDFAGFFCVTDGVNELHVYSEEEIPEGWWQGRRIKGRIAITNGKRDKYIEPEESIPDGWWRGKTQRVMKVTSYGKDYRYITDGTADKKIKPGVEIPEGWWLGTTNAGKVLKGKPNVNKGRIPITDGKKNKLIDKTEQIPEGWWRGQTQKPQPKREGMRVEGQEELVPYIWIHNGIERKGHPKGTEIPKGWQRGLLPKTKTLFWFTNGVKNIRLDPSVDKIPEGFYRGQAQRTKPSNRGRYIWINNGVTGRGIKPDEPIPQGWVRGHLKQAKSLT